MPICSKCGEDKPDDAFAFHNIATGRRQSCCRGCHAASRRAHYLRTKPRYIENERVRVRRHRESNRAQILAYLREHPCVDCGETDPVVLDFDHRDRSTKRLDVARLANKKPWPQVLAEIAKCDVRCASCHRRRTAAQFAWRRAAAVLPSAKGELAERKVVTSQAAVTDMSVSRTCCTCGIAQPLTEFALKDAGTGLRSTKCKTCQRAYAKEHYRRNRQKYLDKAKARTVVNRALITEFIVAYLRQHPCVDCGQTDTLVLEFDHRDRAQKVATINELSRSQNWSALKAEIEKCDVRCANCHRRRTAKQFGWNSRVSEDGQAA